MQPKLTVNDVPMCTEGECEEYDGKRCRLLGARPDSMCEPYVEEMAAELVKLRGTVRLQESAIKNLEHALNPK